MKFNSTDLDSWEGDVKAGNYNAVFDGITALDADSQLEAFALLAERVVVEGGFLLLPLVSHLALYMAQKRTGGNAVATEQLPGGDA